MGSEFFLDAIASPSSYLSESVGGSVSQSCFQISEIGITSTKLASLFFWREVTGYLCGLHVLSTKYNMFHTLYHILVIAVVSGVLVTAYCIICGGSLMRYLPLYCSRMDLLC